MDPRAIEELPKPAAYGRHLVRLFAPEARLAGTGLTAADLASPDSRIGVHQAPQYIRHTLALAGVPDWHLDWARSLADHFHSPPASHWSARRRWAPVSTRSCVSSRAVYPTCACRAVARGRISAPSRAR